MPFYEYECSACKFYVEALQKISDPPMKKCPSCGKEALQRLISAPVFRLKGAGWYETDFKSDKENKRNLVDAGAEKEPAAASSDSDDKKVKVRASKALKKVAARKLVNKRSGEAKPASRPAKKAVKKRLTARPATKETPVKRKLVGKKAARKILKKPARKLPARKK